MLVKWNTMLYGVPFLKRDNTCIRHRVLYEHFNHYRLYFPSFRIDKNMLRRKSKTKLYPQNIKQGLNNSYKSTVNNFNLFYLDYRSSNKIRWKFPSNFRRCENKYIYQTETMKSHELLIHLPFIIKKRQLASFVTSMENNNSI